jgi:predicted GIY-YIG superfamily endonuclease
MSVFPYKDTARWRVQCHDSTQDKNVHVGIYDTETEALQAEAQWYREQKQRRHKTPDRRERSSWTLYRLIGRDGELLYVGISSAALRRFHQHEGKRTWWREVTAVEIEHFASRNEAAAAENRVIRLEHPLYNGRPPLEEAA